jgi:hypothetical protein
MGRTNVLLSLSLVVLTMNCAPRKYQLAEVINLHLHNYATGEPPIVDTYLRVRVDRLISIGDWQTPQTVSECDDRQAN